MFNEDESGKKILKGLEKKKMFKKGCGIIIKFSGLDNIKEGMIVVA